MEGMGEEKPYFLLWKSVKCQKAPLGHSVSTNFVADCGSDTVPSFGILPVFWPPRAFLCKLLDF